MTLKSLTRLWLRSAKKITQSQQVQQKKFLQNVILKPLAKEASSRKILTSAARLTAAGKAVTSITALPGSWQSAYYVTDTIPVRRMQYWLYLPASLSTTVLPLVVMLHGCEQTAIQFAQGTRMNHLAEQKRFAVLYPQQSLHHHPNRCWAWYDQQTQAGGGDIELIAGVIRSVIARAAIDTSRIYLAGMSAGASMAHIVALHHPQLIAAVGLHSGTVFGGGHAKLAALGIMQYGVRASVTLAIDQVVGPHHPFPVLPAILIQGQADHVVRPINLIQLVQQFLHLNRLPPESALPPILKPAGKSRRNPAHAFVTTDYVRGRKPIVRVCDVLQLDHAWSGGDRDFRFNSGVGPNATAMMWRFFSKHRRLQARTT